MAAIVLTTAATSVAGSLGLGTVGTALLKAGAGLAGGLIDRSLFGGRDDVEREGPRLKDVDVTASTEGASIPRVYGRVRLGGQIIWATEIEEQSTTETEEVGGKGGGGGSTVTTTTYSYFANVAVGVSEGYVHQFLRVWADGRELDLRQVRVRFHLGSDSQGPDPLIEAKEGAGRAPAYRGTAYVVFERLPLEDYGNRIPQFSFEVVRRIGALEPAIPAVAMIPGATEFGYHPAEIQRVAYSGQGDVVWSETENRHHFLTASDWQTSLAHLGRMLPHCEMVHLVVAWFGTDLRAGVCKVEPRVERHDKNTHPISWQVAGLSRTTARIVTRHAGRPAYGGSPNDASVIAAIRDLKSRGYKVLVHPFIMMDIPASSGLADPYGRGQQPPYPWRGRITCHPAPGRPGSPDRTGTAASQVAAFVGGAQPGHFGAAGDRVLYAGPGEWSYRRFVLHAAQLAKMAGGVHAFLIGSEMVGLTTVRSGTTTYPFVDALRALAGSVRAMLGSGTKIGYGADWTEYHSHRPNDGTGHVYFNMDPLWADPNIDFIGIDNYLPMSDWRGGTDHLDHDPWGPTVPYDPAYLQANVEGGEYYDWYYTSTSARRVQARTPISDTASGEDWVFRQKDIRNWWLNRHRHRPNGGSGGLSPWIAQSKPIWFTEIGFPALDNSANQPNVFYDPKSSESMLPHLSTGARDDAMQRAALKALIDYWQPARGNNPVSTVYGGRMIDPKRLFVWAWDARPAPAFPRDLALWGDGTNWRFGHWISGRMGTAPIEDLLRQMAHDHGIGNLTIEPMGGSLDGYVIDRPASFRRAVEPLASIFGIDAIETGSRIRLRGRRGQGRRLTVGRDALAEAEDGEPLKVQRQDLSELPAVARIAYQDTDLDGRPGSVEAMRSGSPGTDRVLSVETSGVLDADQMGGHCEAMLRREWARRDTAEFELMPSRLALEPGDVIAIDDDGDARSWLVTEIGDAEGRRINGERILDGLFETGRGTARAEKTQRQSPASPAAAIPSLAFVEFRPPEGLSNGASDRSALFAAATASPWSRGVVLYRQIDEDTLRAVGHATEPARMGRLVGALHAGPVWRWDRVNAFTVELARGTLSSKPEAAILSGGNALAVEDPDGGWEILQFRDAELIAERTYRLSHLLRGQAGSEAFAARLKSDSRVVVLDDALLPVPSTAFAIGRPATWRFAPYGVALEPEVLRERDYTPRGDSLRPLSPVHLAARRLGADGDLALTWIRRTRVQGDGWELVEVPLGEASEAYRVEIGAGGTVRRTLSVTEPRAVYRRSDQLADFGAISPIDVTVSQMSATIGAGEPLRRSLDV